MVDLDGFLAGAQVDAAVFALRPDYRALLLAVDGIVPRAPAARRAPRCCERRRPRAGRRCATGRRSSFPTSRRGGRAYRAFGAKPQRARNSLEALLRGAASGCPG